MMKTVDQLLGVISEVRRYAIEAVLIDGYPSSDMVECLAILTDTLRAEKQELPSVLGRRVIMNSTGEEGVITGHINGYTIFIDGEEIFHLNALEDVPITRDDFTFAEDVK